MIIRNIFEGKQPTTELIGDGRTVWVNAADGSNIARFGRYGIDVHTSITAQIDGAPQCLACTHGLTHLADWRRFQALVKHHYNVKVADDMMPDHIKREMK